MSGARRRLYIFTKHSQQDLSSSGWRKNALGLIISIVIYICRGGIHLFNDTFVNLRFYGTAEIFSVENDQLWTQISKVDYQNFPEIKIELDSLGFPLYLYIWHVTVNLIGLLKLNYFHATLFWNVKMPRPSFRQNVDVRHFPIYFLSLLSGK